MSRTPKMKEALHLQNQILAAGASCFTVDDILFVNQQAPKILNPEIPDNIMDWIISRFHEILKRAGFRTGAVEKSKSEQERNPGEAKT